MGFYVGAELIINAHKFKLIKADESTLSHMEKECENFKFSNKTAILEKLAQKLWDRSFSKTKTFRHFDKNHDRFISEDEFKEMCRTYGWILTDQELLTIWRHYDDNGDGQIDYTEFYEALETHRHHKKGSVIGSPEQLQLIKQSANIA